MKSFLSSVIVIGCIVAGTGCERREVRVEEAPVPEHTVVRREAKPDPIEVHGAAMRRLQEVGGQAAKRFSGTADGALMEADVRRLEKAYRDLGPTAVPDRRAAVLAELEAARNKAEDARIEFITANAEVKAEQEAVRVAWLAVDAKKRELAEAAEREQELAAARAAATPLAVSRQPPQSTAYPSYTPSYSPSYSGSGGGSVHVRGYTRKDGTYVRAHTRRR